MYLGETPKNPSEQHELCLVVVVLMHCRSQLGPVAERILLMDLVDLSAVELFKYNRRQDLGLHQGLEP